jgi:hypothetical protein
MLAQRWEKPSTAQEERLAISRARRLCKKKRKGVTVISKDQKSSAMAISIFALQQQNVVREFEDFCRGGTFFAISSPLGILPKILAIISGGLSQNLAQSILFAKNVVSNIAQRRPNLSSQQHATALVYGVDDEHEMTLYIRWDSSTMRNTFVSASKGFCENIAGMSVSDFHIRMDSCGLPLACTLFQWLCYLVDGALCVGEGCTSWIRYSFVLLSATTMY